MEINSNSAIEAVIILNYLIADFVTGTIVFIDYRERYKLEKLSEIQLSAVERMCFSHLALSLSKLLEFWKDYHHLLPEKHHGELKELNKEIRKKGIENFRNKVSGHILDKESKKPLTPSEIMNLLEGLIGEHADTCLNWINNPANNTYPNTVVIIVETIRDSIAQDYDITPNEIINS